MPVLQIPSTAVNMVFQKHLSSPIGFQIIGTLQEWHTINIHSILTIVLLSLTYSSFADSVSIILIILPIPMHLSIISRFQEYRCHPRSTMANIISKCTQKKNQSKQYTIKCENTFTYYIFVLHSKFIFIYIFYIYLVIVYFFICILIYWILIF